MARRGVLLSAGLLVVLAVGHLGAGSASAELNGDCSGVQGTIEETGVAIDPAQGDGPFEVPLEGTVVWTGTVADGSETEPRATSGDIVVVGPPLLDTLFGDLLELRTWGDDDAVTTTEAGVDTYELPDYTPRDAELIVTGEHDDPAGSCDGSVTIVVAGDPMDSALTIGAVVATVVTGALVALAGIARGPR